MELGRRCSLSLANVFGTGFLGKNDSDGWLHIISSGTNIWGIIILRCLYMILFDYNDHAFFVIISGLDNCSLPSP
jgi:hypothetical protein